MRASSYVLYSNYQVRLVAEQLSLRSDCFENKLPLPFRLQRRKIVIVQSTAARDQTNGCEAGCVDAGVVQRHAAKDRVIRKRDHG